MLSCSPLHMGHVLHDLYTFTAQVTTTFHTPTFLSQSLPFQTVRLITATTILCLVVFGPTMMNSRRPSRLRIMSSWRKMWLSSSRRLWMSHGNCFFSLDESIETDVGDRTPGLRQQTAHNYTICASHRENVHQMAILSNLRLPVTTSGMHL